MDASYLSPEELPGVNKFKVDEGQPHIIVDKEICATCENKPCLVVCSAVCYQLSEEGEIQFDYAGCLECGTCRIVCRSLGKGGVTGWAYTRPTFGVSFHYG